jgi:hypothetical protein
MPVRDLSGRRLTPLCNPALFVGFQHAVFLLASAEAAAGDMLHRHVGGDHCVFYFRKGQASQRMPP